MAGRTSCSTTTGEVYLRLQLLDFRHGSPGCWMMGPLRKGKSNQKSLQPQSCVPLLEGKWAMLHHYAASVTLAQGKELDKTLTLCLDRLSTGRFMFLDTQTGQ